MELQTVYIIEFDDEGLWELVFTTLEEAMDAFIEQYQAYLSWVEPEDLICMPTPEQVRDLLPDYNFYLSGFGRIRKCKVHGSFGSI